MCYANKVMHLAITPMLPWSSMGRISTNSVAMKFDRYEPIDYFKGLGKRFIYTQDYAQILESFRQLSRQYGSIYLQMSSGHLQNRCHLKLLQFTGLEEVDVHDIRHLYHDHGIMRLGLSAQTVRYRSLHFFICSCLYSSKLSISIFRNCIFILFVNTINSQ